MTPKILKYWEGVFFKACGLACLYNCCLSLDQFCASHGLEEEDRDALKEYFQKKCICD